MRFQTTTTHVCCRPGSSVVTNCRQIPALAPLSSFHKAHKRNVATRTPRTRHRSAAGLSIPKARWNYPGNNVRSLNRPACPRAHHQESDVNVGLKVMGINRSVTRQIWRGDNPGNISDLKLETDELGASASGGGKIFKDQLAASLSTLRVDGFDCIIDAVAGDYFKPGHESLTKGGRHVVYGASSFTPTGDKPNWISLAWKYLRRPVVDPMEMMSDNKSVMALT